MRKLILFVVVCAIAMLAVLPAAAGSERVGRRPRPTVVPIVTLVPTPICPDGCPPPDQAP